MLKHSELERLLDLKKLPLPNSPRVKRIEFYEAPDSTGDLSIFVWVLLDDTTPDSEQTAKKVAPIDEAIRERLRNADEERFAYIRFQTESEYREPVEV